MNNLQEGMRDDWREDGSKWGISELEGNEEILKSAQYESLIFKTIQKIDSKIKYSFSWYVHRVAWTIQTTHAEPWMSAHDCKYLSS